MNKKIISAFIAATLLTTITTHKAEANSQPATLAILDTALDTSLPIFKDKIAYEVCILQWNSCPNGKPFMEGPGSAVLPTNIMSSSNFKHGTEMASVAIQSNPNMKIVFVRIIGHTSAGARQLTGPAAIANALNWVSQNKDRFNIQAVSMSQGHHNLKSSPDYCPINASVEQAINKLVALSVPVFLATGNNSDAKRIDWPSCDPDAIAIGAVDTINAIAFYSNADTTLTDFYAPGNSVAHTVGGNRINVAGTSVSTQIAAANWITLRQAKPLLSYIDTYNLIKNTASKVSSARVPSGLKIELEKAING